MMQVVMGTLLQVTLQVEALPLRTSRVEGSPSSQETGQFPSQVSPASMVPSPHVVEQSLSLALVQPAAQQPSSSVHVAIVVFSHSTLHVAALPRRTSVVQLSPSSHAVGHEPSHVSPTSTVPLPHDALQSSSTDDVQPEGQHPSPEAHCVTSIVAHSASQF
jgi:hypothetical protein